MEPEGSLPHSQQPANCLYPESERSSPCPPSHLSKIHFNIILSTPGSSKWYPSLKLPHKNPVYKSLPHTCHMPCPSQFSWIHYPNTENNWTYYLCISGLWLGLRLDDREIEADSRREKKKVLPFRYSNKNCVCIPYLYHVCSNLLQTRSWPSNINSSCATHVHTKSLACIPPRPRALQDNLGQRRLIVQVSKSHTLTNTLSRSPLNEWSARTKGLYVQNTHNRQTPMPPAGFEPTIPASERPLQSTFGVLGFLNQLGQVTLGYVHNIRTNTSFYSSLLYLSATNCTRKWVWMKM
jgi:hypothetical protein